MVPIRIIVVIIIIIIIIIAIITIVIIIIIIIIIIIMGAINIYKCYILGLHDSIILLKNARPNCPWPASHGFCSSCGWYGCGR